MTEHRQGMEMAEIQAGYAKMWSRQKGEPWVGPEDKALLGSRGRAAVRAGHLSWERKDWGMCGCGPEEG